MANSSSTPMTSVSSSTMVSTASMAGIGTGAGGSATATSTSSPCAGCKLLRRKCQPDCVFAPYFPPDNMTKFAQVHRIFGASNVTKLLNDLPPFQREDAVNSLAYEAEMRVRDPVYGCVGIISLLQHRLRQLQTELVAVRAQLAKFQAEAAGVGFGREPAAAVFCMASGTRDQQQPQQQQQQQLQMIPMHGGEAADHMLMGRFGSTNGAAYESVGFFGGFHHGVGVGAAGQLFKHSAAAAAAGEQRHGDHQEPRSWECVLMQEKLR